MPLTLRLRHNGRAVTLSDVPEDATVAALRELIAAKTGVPTARQVLKVGVPPVLLKDQGGNASLAEAGCSDRETVVVEEQEPLAASPQGAPRAGGAGALPSAPGCGTPPDEPPAAGPAPKRRRSSEPGASAPAAAAAAGRGGAEDVPESDLLPAFDRAIAAAVRHAKMLPEDQHQVWALRRGKAAVLESLKRGDNLSLGALHSLKGVGHWVVEQVREHLREAGAAPPAGGRAPVAGRGGRAAPAPTPGDFTWWYVGRDGKAVEDRNSAEAMGPLGSEQYRVCILHASGRLEKAYLPEAKAPPRCAKAPPRCPGGGPA